VLRSAAVSGRSGRLTPLAAAALAGALAGCLLALPADAARGAGSAERAAAEERGAALNRRAHVALLQLYALESSVDRARAYAGALEARSLELGRRVASAARRVGIVRRSLAVTRAQTAGILERLYVEGGTDPIALLLGATSLDEALAGLDGLERTAHRNRRLANDLRATLGRLQRLEVSLRVQRQALDAARRRAADAVAELSRRVDARTAFAAGLRARGALWHARAAELERQARAAAGVTASLAAERTPEASWATPIQQLAPVAGPRALTVDAVGYHLPGRTASGLPVGHGIVAVDPTVIPLGTRLHVPGYGSAVAADVGSAVQGHLIDLWFPSRKHALAWGRRTVTITIYG
jgi:3D (Asp-Asp-Asp) domain-containing protein/septal ring factor EnvC (AmiA/AmiB activator)